MKKTYSKFRDTFKGNDACRHEASSLFKTQGSYGFLGPCSITLAPRGPTKGKEAKNGSASVTFAEFTI